MFLDWSELYGSPPAPVGPVAKHLVTHAVDLLRDFGATLIGEHPRGAFVEVTPIRVGRYPQLLREVAQRAPVHIVAATGFWCEALHPIHPWVREFRAAVGGVDGMAELFIREIEDGMEDPAGPTGVRFTDIPAGIIKVGTSTYLQPSERDINHAAALASAQTGCCIIAHTTCGGGWEEAELLIARGARPDRIIIGHQGHLDDRERPEALDYHRRLAELGCFVAFDRIGMKDYELPKQARQVVDLIARGHLDQVLLGHDRLACLVPDPEVAPKSADLWRDDDEGFATVTTEFARVLKEYGVSDSQLGAMLVENPRRALAF